MVNWRESQKETSNEKEKDKGRGQGRADEQSEDGEGREVTNGEDGSRELGGEGLEAKLLDGVRRASAIDSDGTAAAAVGTVDSGGSSGWSDGSRRQRVDDSGDNQINLNDLQMEYEHSPPAVNRSTSRSLSSSPKHY